jgi:hypothetical protein
VSRSRAHTFLRERDWFHLLERLQRSNEHKLTIQSNLLIFRVSSTENGVDFVKHDRQDLTEFRDLIVQLLSKHH